MKVCNECNKELAFDNFYKKSKTFDGYTNPCKDCLSISKKDLTKKKCKRHGLLNAEDIGIRVVNSIDPISILTRCLICERERIKKRSSGNGRLNENKAKKKLICTECNIEKRVSQFTVSELKKKTAYRCSLCISTINKRSKATLNEDVLRRKMLKKKFNISLEEYKQMLQSQNGLCLICNQSEIYKRPSSEQLIYLSVDHCHKTGRIRGLLCKHCNLMLGNALDNPDSLRKGADYLDKYA